MSFFRKNDLVNIYGSKSVEGPTESKTQRAVGGRGKASNDKAGVRDLLGGRGLFVFSS